MDLLCMYVRMKRIRFKMSYSHAFSHKIKPVAIISEFNIRFQIQRFNHCDNDNLFSISNKIKLKIRLKNSNNPNKYNVKYFSHFFWFILKLLILCSLHLPQQSQSVHFTMLELYTTHLALRFSTPNFAVGPHFTGNNGN